MSAWARRRAILARMRDVTVKGDEIRLGQLLKLAGLADSGGDAKALLAAGEVAVNGEPEARRGRRLTDGDVVSALGDDVRVRVRGRLEVLGEDEVRVQRGGEPSIRSSSSAAWRSLSASASSAVARSIA